MFFIICFCVTVAIYLISYLFATFKQSEAASTISFAASLLAVVFLFIIIIAGTEADELENKIEQMRMNPENFSVQAASEANIELVKMEYWKNSIFSWHHDFDTTLLDLSNFANI